MANPKDVFRKAFWVNEEMKPIRKYGNRVYPELANSFIPLGFGDRIIYYLNSDELLAFDAVGQPYVVPVEGHLSFYKDEEMRSVIRPFTGKLPEGLRKSLLRRGLRRLRKLEKELNDEVLLDDD